MSNFLIYVVFQYSSTFSRLKTTRKNLCANAFLGSKQGTPLYEPEQLTKATMLYYISPAGCNFPCLFTVLHSSKQQWHLPAARSSPKDRAFGSSPEDTTVLSALLPICDYSGDHDLGNFLQQSYYFLIGFKKWWDSNK